MLFLSYFRPRATVREKIFVLPVAIGCPSGA
jgi:hypothetical protein